MADACLFTAWSTSENKALITDLAEQEFKQGAKWKTIHALIEEGFIEVTDCAEKEMATLVETRNTRGVNIVDASIIFLCKEKSGIVLTEDPKLRACCFQESVSCSEILWVFDHLLHTGNLQFSAALEGLNTLTSRGSRLKMVEVEKRVEAWTQKLALPPIPNSPNLNGSKSKRKAKTPTKTISPET